MKKAMLVIALCALCHAVVGAQTPFPPNWGEVSFGVQQNLTVPPEIALDPTTNIPHILFSQEVATNDKRLYEIWKDAQGVTHKIEVCRLDTGGGVFDHEPTQISLAISPNGAVGVALCAMGRGICIDPITGNYGFLGITIVYYGERSASGAWDPNTFAIVFSEGKASYDGLTFQGVCCDLQYDFSSQPTLLIGSTIYTYNKDLNGNVDDQVTTRSIIMNPMTEPWIYGPNDFQYPFFQPYTGKMIYFYRGVGNASIEGICSVALKNIRGTSTYAMCLGYNAGARIWSCRSSITGMGTFSAPSYNYGVRSASGTTSGVTHLALEVTNWYGLKVPHVAYTLTDNTSFYTNGFYSYSMHSPILGGYSNVASLTCSTDELMVMASVLVLDPSGDEWDAKVRMYKTWSGVMNQHDVALLKEYTNTAVDPQNLGLRARVLPFVATNYSANTTLGQTRFNVMICDRDFQTTYPYYFPWTLYFSRNIP